MQSAATSPSELPAPAAPALQRTRGDCRISFRRRGDRTVMVDLFQRGASKIRLPRRSEGPAEAVLINTAGGLTGGDRIAVDVALEPGAEATVTTQACERIYRSLGGPAEVSARIDVADGAHLAWLPQETILFDRAKLFRSIEADLASGGSLLLAEAVLFGRAASGERVVSGALRDRWRVRRDGQLIFADNIAIEGPMADVLARPAAGGGAGAVATLLLIEPDAERHLDALRSAVGEAGGASAWDGKLVVRLLAADGLSLRRTLIPVISLLRSGRPPPLVWQL